MDTSRLKSAPAQRTWGALVLLLPPALWFLDQQLSFALVPWSCRHHTRAVLYAISVATLLSVAGSAALGWVLRGRATGSAVEKFFINAGLLSSLMFALAIAAQAVPRFLAHPCQ